MTDHHHAQLNRDLEHLRKMKDEYAQIESSITQNFPSGIYQMPNEVAIINSTGITFAPLIPLEAPALEAPVNPSVLPEDHPF